MSDGTYRMLAAAVIIAHQRAGASSCLCGGLTLGSSHAEHVAEKLEQVGALNSPPRLRVATVHTDVLVTELEARGHVVNSRAPWADAKDTP